MFNSFELLVGSTYRHKNSGRLYQVQSIAQKGKINGAWEDKPTVHYATEEHTDLVFWRYKDDFLRAFEFVSH